MWFVWPQFVFHEKCVVHKQPLALLISSVSKVNVWKYFSLFSLLFPFSSLRSSFGRVQVNKLWWEMCSAPSLAQAASSSDPSTPTYINVEGNFIFLESASKKFLMSRACGFAATGNLLCAGVGLLRLSWIKHLVVAQQPICDVGAGHRELVGRTGRCRSDMKVQLKFNFLQNHSFSTSCANFPWLNKYT